MAKQLFEDFQLYAALRVAAVLYPEPLVHRDVRDILILGRLTDLSLGDIAAVMGVSPDTVRSWSCRRAHPSPEHEDLLQKLGAVLAARAAARGVAVPAASAHSEHEEAEVEGVAS